MKKRKDWLPRRREPMANMAVVWLRYITEERAAAWGIPAGVLVVLRARVDAALAALAKTQNRPKRTHVFVVECIAAFEALEDAMRDMKRRYFLMPPLTPSDWASLGLAQEDEHYTVMGPPSGTPRVNLGYEGGACTLTAHLRPVEGSEGLHPESDYGYAVYLGIMPPGGATLEEAAGEKHYLMRPPQGGNGLLHYRFTRRNKLRIYFDEEDAGKTAFVCVRYENQKGDEGGWGPVTSAVIPGAGGR